MDVLCAAEGERERDSVCPTLPAGVKDVSPFIQFRDLLEDFIQFTARVYISVHLQVMTGTSHQRREYFPDSSSLGFQVKQSNDSPGFTQQKNK